MLTVSHFTRPGGRYLSSIENVVFFHGQANGSKPGAKYWISELEYYCPARLANEQIPSPKDMCSLNLLAAET